MWNLCNARVKNGRKGRWGEREREMKVEEAFDEEAKEREKDEGQQRWGATLKLTLASFLGPSGSWKGVGRV